MDSPPTPGSPEPGRHMDQYGAISRDEGHQSTTPKETQMNAKKQKTLNALAGRVGRGALGIRSEEPGTVEITQYRCGMGWIYRANLIADAPWPAFGREGDSVGESFDEARDKLLFLAKKHPIALAP